MILIYGLAQIFQGLKVSVRLGCDLRKVECCIDCVWVNSNNKIKNLS